MCARVGRLTRQVTKPENDGPFRAVGVSYTRGIQKLKLPSNPRDRYLKFVFCSRHTILNY